MHQYQEAAKDFLVGYVIETRKTKSLTKNTMSIWLRIDPRSYSEIEKGTYGLSAASLLCFQCNLADTEILNMVHSFRSRIGQQVERDGEMGNPYTNINDLLYRLGVTANYTGFFYTAYVVQLCMEDPERLTLVTKWVYPDVAKQYGTNWKAVERDIRTVANIIWEQGQSKLEQLAGRKLEEKPCNAQLLAILTYAMLSPHGSGPLPVHGLRKTVALP